MNETIHRCALIPPAVRTVGGRPIVYVGSQFISRVAGPDTRGSVDSDLRIF